jgi:hypothetical protein
MVGLFHHLGGFIAQPAVHLSDGLEGRKKEEGNALFHSQETKSEESPKRLESTKYRRWKEEPPQLV